MSAGERDELAPAGSGIWIVEGAAPRHFLVVAIFKRGSRVNRLTFSLVGAVFRYESGASSDSSRSSDCSVSPGLVGLGASRPELTAGRAQ